MTLRDEPERDARRPAGRGQRYPVGDGLGRGKAGSLDAQAFTAAATFGLAGFSPFRKRSARGEAEGPGDGRAVGLAAGMASPWPAMQVRKAWSAVPKPPRPRSPHGLHQSR